MEIEFDPVKDEANKAKHGISLTRASELDIRAVIEDDRFEEQRYRLYGMIDSAWYCLAAVFRENRTRAISLRRAHQEEVDKHVG